MPHCLAQLALNQLHIFMHDCMSLRVEEASQVLVFGGIFSSREYPETVGKSKQGADCTPRGADAQILMRIPQRALLVARHIPPHGRITGTEQRKEASVWFTQQSIGRNVFEVCEQVGSKFHDGLMDRNVVLLV